MSSMFTIKRVLGVGAIVAAALTWRSWIEFAPLALVALGILLAPPAIATITAVVSREIPLRPWHVLKRYLYELSDFILDLIAWPIVFLLIPLQMAAGILLFVGAGLILGLLACVIQNVTGISMGLMKSWSDIGIMALITLGLFVVGLPLTLLSQVAEEEAVPFYQFLASGVEEIHDKIRAWFGLGD
ncbi:MAG: hypothetical protein FJX76_02280 [Armatimonadetes bacterium]|nr:hypothetical protein [Armatimonadota bacterium]